MSVDPLLTAAQMRAAEQAAFANGLSEYDLMERAGAAAAEIIWRAGGMRDALILCGPGNNGGDGFVIARLLRARGVPVRVAVTGDSRTASSQRARDLWNGPVEPLGQAAPASQIVDALFGTGLSRGLEQVVADRLGALVEQAAISYAIDLPSGVDSDSDALLSAVPRFGVCIALGAFKPAHLLYPAADRAARLVRAEIGIDVSSDCHRLSAPTIAAPGAGAHKYNRGLVAVIGGSMAGASLLAARAAAHGGCGMVRLIASTTPSCAPDAIVTVAATGAVAVGAALADRRVSVVLVGPGLGRDAHARSRLEAAIEGRSGLVIDADALGLIAPEEIPANAILTPHEGEFVRLFGDLSGSKIDRARAAAKRSRGVIVYKGADSVIAAPDGRVAVASGASPWLSTAGTGDVLAGIAAARLAVTGDPFRAACEAVWLHGEAARRAGPAFIADDLIRHVPAAIASRL